MKKAKLRRLKRRGYQVSRCAYCKRKLTARSATRDHVVPKSKGGGEGRSNIVIACRGCNQQKRAKTIVELGVANPVPLRWRTG